MNKVILLGRLGKNPEIRFAQSGTAVLNCSLATSKKIKGEDITQWHRLVAFGKTAAIIERYVTKGDQLAIEGEISYGNYEKDGQKIYTTDIIVNTFHFVGSKKDQQQNQQQGNQPQQQEPTRQKQQEPEDDIPF